MELSIITINKNNVVGLKKTIESVLHQSFKDYEFIIIDGNSSDESKNLIKQYENSISHWVSEQDTGVYNAMNKGISLAKGKYCHFLNSGDTYWNDVLVKIFSKKQTADILYCNYFHNNILYKYPSKLTNQWFYHGTINHQSVIIKRSLQVKNPFDENLKYVSDWKILIYLFIKEKRSFKHINMAICNYDSTGISSLSKNQENLTQERLKILRENYLPKQLNSDDKITIKLLDLIDSSATVYIKRNDHTYRFNGTQAKLIYNYARLINKLSKIISIGK